MVKRTFKASIPRRMYRSENLEQSGVCPECGALLAQEMHSFLAVAETKMGTDEFIIGDYGYFCPVCPLVVLNLEKFAESLSLACDPRAFTITGIVDLDAVPEDKEHLIVGDDDNPIPLVEFLNPSDTLTSCPSSTRKAERKIGRNESCPCGSGRKYKKCCLLRGRG